MMKRIPHVALTLMLSGAGLMAQPPSSSTPARQPDGDVLLALLQGRRDDPAFAVYKEGYGFILDERWGEAQKAFNRMFSRYPASKYVEDARYWSTYALARIDREKALEQYGQFLKAYPSSRYLPDALADIAALQGAAPIAAPTPPDSGLIFRSFRLSLPNLRLMALNFSRMKRTLRHHLISLKMMRFPLDGEFPAMPGESDGIDDATRLKIESLRALGETQGDAGALETFRKIALDRTQPLPLREVAIDEMSKLHGTTPLPTLVEIAREDPSRDVRNLATLSIGGVEGDKAKTLDALAGLYQSLPHGREDQRAYILDAVAEIGGDRSLDFLAGVAKTPGDAELQLSAIDYIGETGRDKNKSLGILISLFGSLPKGRTEARQTVLYSVADIGNDRAVDFLVTVARSGEDTQLRSDAVCLLGNIGGDKAKAALYELLTGH